MSNSFGRMLRFTVFGQSHGEAIGVVMDGLPAGERVDMDELQAFLDRRAPGRAAYATARKEADRVEVLSGLVNGFTCGAPFAALIRNMDAQSDAYLQVQAVPRPSHADYPAMMRDGAYADLRGGGQFSGRLTAALCIAGGLAKQMLERRGVLVGAHIHSIAGIADTPYHPVEIDAQTLLAPGKAAFPVLHAGKGARMQEAIAHAAGEGDSVGGVVECCALGLPPGLGDTLYGSLEGRLSQVIFGIPAVRGVEFGAGFAAAGMRGSAHNDAYVIADGQVKTRTNNHGGILGGLCSGMPLLLRVAFKPTPSIAKEQQSVDIGAMKEVPLSIGGRHDPCLVPRAVACVEAAVCCVLLDDMLLRSGC